ncbi:uncharacterized protein LOC126983949 [Eriocheir sinensis]|uniref:uncharacterized protein LOC126983949 n=1 Tax=Eriocheir sinensis TaxID=95602 RepID=UPI0021C857C5|nr:uncharacterized protein LOC126983949 [Eriocheir sinensis]
MDDPPPADDSGFYYYYYPVEEGGKGKDKGKGGLGYKDDYYKCSEEKLLAPLIIICIFLGIIAFRDIGLVPSFHLPTIELPTIDIPNIDLPDVEINRGRNFASSVSKYLPWHSLNNATVAVLAAVEAEECLPWLLCESGRLAQGRSTTLSLMEVFAPPKYQPQVKIFKEAATLRTNCDKYKCGTFKKPLCALLEALGGRC